MRVGLLGACLAVALSSSPSEAAPPHAGSGEEAAIRANVAAYEAAWSSRDVAGVVATFASDGDLVAFDGPRIAGHAALRRRIESDFAMTAASTRIRLTVTSVRLLDPQTAVVETEAHFSEGSIPDNRGTSVLVRQGRTWLVAALRVFPAASSATSAPDAPAAQDAAAADAVRTADRALSQTGCIDKNLEAFVASWEPTGSLMIANAPVATGPEALRAVFAPFFALPGFHCAWEPAQVEVARSGDLAYSTGHYSNGFSDPQGKAVEDRGSYLTVWRKDAAGRWRVAFDSVASGRPAAKP